ncbi:hypothetical protein JCM19236_6333 [Vibrio sp. JCM 19236]|nr:hypothetical protein JCM19236_6333 [Vibrio sp. JCM 19236]
MLKKIITISCLGLLTVGCSSTPDVDLSSASPAYNKAYGTYLTEPYKFGGRTYKSKLRDFSEDEAKEAERAFEKSSGGNVSILFGGVALLTGDLTGAIDVAGGAAANIASSRHPSARSGWVVSVDASSAKDGIEAKKIATSVIQSATVNLLRSKGNKIEMVVTKEAGVAKVGGAEIPPKTAYQLNDAVLFGMNNDHFYDDKRGFELNKDKSAYVPTGNTIWWGVDVANYMAFDKGYVKGYEGIEGYEQFMEDLTSALPSEYMYYSSPVPRQLLIENKDKSSWACSDCLEEESFLLYTQQIPRIYTNGEKLDFIKSAK